MARRNLESVFKRQFEESEKKRLTSELELNVLKKYLTLFPSTTSSVPDVGNEIEQLKLLIDNLISKLSFSSSSSRNTDSNSNSSRTLEESHAISTLRIDQIQYEPKPIRLQKIENLIMETMNANEIKLNGRLSSNSCIDTDIQLFKKILLCVNSLFQHYDIKPTISIDFVQDQGFSILNIFFQESDEKGTKLALLQKFYEISINISEDISKVSTLDDMTTTTFICKTLCEAMGGEFIIDSSKINITITCELLEDGKCAPNSESSTSLPIKDNLPEKSIIPLKSEIEFAKDTVPVSEPIKIPLPVIENTEKTSNDVKQKKKTIEGKILYILLVEDGPILQAIFRKFWEKRNHTVVIAKNGQEAIELFKTQNFSIIFCDIEMPIKNGVATVKEMRAYEQEKHKPKTPIIGVSGSQKKYKEAALEAGMDDFISKDKGFQMNMIYDLVTEYCGTLVDSSS